MGQKYHFNIFCLLIILICACSVRSQAVCGGCLCNPPDIDATTVKATYLVRKITGNSSISWALDVNITWAAPLNTSHDYAVYFTRYNGGPFRCFDSVMNEQFTDGFGKNFTCPISQHRHRHVTGELYSEMDIAFGYTYIMDVCLYNVTENALAPYSICITRIHSADCYEETQDVDFCKKQPIVVSGKPVNASLSHFTLGDDSSDNATINALISWSDPIQVNGAINRYSIESYDGTMRLNVWNENAQRNDNASGVYEVQIPGLSPSTQYRVEITPNVRLPSDQYQSGPEAEISFTTPPLTDLQVSTITTTSPISTSNATTMMIMISSSGQDTTVTSGRVIDVLTIGIVSSIGTIFLITLLILAIVCARKKPPPVVPPGPPKYPRKPGISGSVDPVFKDKEVRHDQVEIGKRLGSGQFGVVYCGRLLGHTMKHLMVAVKTVKDDVSDNMKHDFLNEIRLMIEISRRTRHPNVMEVLACCTATFPYYMVTEMLKYGDLRNFLLKCNKKSEHIQSDSIYNISDLQRYQMARQIAGGMMFISSKRFYHGDLAARNILVGSGLIVKISDFGLSSDIYQKGYQRLSAERKRPVKWASIETNLEGKCTIQSDVWSYGVVLYEIFTNGKTPYKDMDGREVIRRVRDGYRMAKPGNCPDEVYEMMLLCWHEMPGSRPHFKDLFNFFDTKIKDSSTLEYIDVNNDENTQQYSKPPAGTANPSQAKPSHPDSDYESGVSVSITDWKFERDSSLKKEGALKSSARTATSSQAKPSHPDSGHESGVSVSITDWKFERDSSLRKETT